MNPSAMPVYSDIEVVFAAYAWLDDGVTQSAWMMRSIGKFAARFAMNNLSADMWADRGRLRAIVRMALTKFTADHSAAIRC
jgi:hypothetical protein